MRVRVLVVLPIVALGGVGCAKALDETTLERMLAEQVGARLAEPEMRVDCPSDVEAEAGGVFTCTATARDGAVTVVEVTQQDDRGHVAWRLVDAAPAGEEDAG